MPFDALTLIAAHALHLPALRAEQIVEMKIADSSGANLH